MEFLTEESQFPSKSGEFPGEFSVKLMLESKPLGYWLTSCLRVFSDTPKCGVQVFASRNV